MSKVPGFSVEEVLIWTRLAADKVGPTKMDRPEDVQPNPVNGRIYAAMTNNTSRTPAQIDEANPRASNKHGHVTEFTPAGGDHGALTFTWKIVLVAGDPSDPQTYFNGYDKSEVSPIACPDNVAFDATGNLWISTDGMPGTLNHCDGLYVMPLEGRSKGKPPAVPLGAGRRRDLRADDPGSRLGHRRRAAPRRGVGCLAGQRRLAVPVPRRRPAPPVGDPRLPPPRPLSRDACRRAGLP